MIQHQKIIISHWIELHPWSQKKKKPAMVFSGCFETSKNIPIFVKKNKIKQTRLPITKSQVQVAGRMVDRLGQNLLTNETCTNIWHS